MFYILDIIACGLVVFTELIGVLVIAMLTQFIFYRLFKVNLYRNCIRCLDKMDRKTSEIFG